MYNSEKVATLGTHNTKRRQRKQKCTTHYALDITIRKQTQI